MQFTESYRRFLEADQKIFTDTRKPIPGGIYLALNGPHFNGNLFAMEALSKGASFAVVDQKVGDDPRLIVVENTLLELQGMANLHRKNSQAKIIAITGTNGKTTTKELAHSIFKQEWNAIATEGNLNNHIGVPLTLLKLKKDTRILILEMGANQPGDIKSLCDIADPDAGLITNIGMAHLEGFGDLEGVRKTKLELFDYLKAHQGIRFCNLFSEILLQYYRQEGDCVSFGPEEFEGRYLAHLIQSFPEIKMEFIDHLTRFPVWSQLFGSYNFQNIVAAISLARYYGISVDAIQRGVAAYVPSNMRSQIIKKDSNTIILDAYNANPSSMSKALEAFDQMEFQNKWSVLGEMAELGSYAEKAHLEILESVSKLHFQKCIFIGSLYSKVNMQENCYYFETIESCKTWLQENWPTHTGILIKGSRAAGLERLLNE